ncbi:hypothetical protein [uncultured Proteiniphilum sp.]|uniref:hypothetical protein n=1 Tax=uncultured Proteiniphilum sp. TaxID=497637 RepID=UPI00260C30A6|nr:hypothetical protein [uncultured Proteiniphilum sp.]
MKYLNYNFSDILKPRRILGIIGDNYQRLQIKFLSIKKMKVFHQNILFAGNLKSISAILKERLSLKKYKRLFVSEMDSIICIKANTLFRECQPPDTFCMKIVRKIMRASLAEPCNLLWYIDNSKNLKYDDMFAFSDCYYNNAFVGTWQAYETSKKKICNFGEYRIPFIKPDLDVGSGEFYPNPKYKNNRWQKYGYPEEE